MLVYLHFHSILNIGQFVEFTIDITSANIFRFQVSELEILKLNNNPEVKI